MDAIVRLFFAQNGLEEFLPYDVDLFQEDVHHTTAYKTLYERLDNVGQLTTSLLQRCAREDEEHTKGTFLSNARYAELLQRVYEQWLETYVETYESMCETQTVTLRDEDSDDDNEDERHQVASRKVRMTMGTNVYVELGRLFYLLRRPVLIVEQAPDEWQSMQNTRHEDWVRAYHTFEAKYNEPPPALPGEKQKEEEDDEDVTLFKAKRDRLWKRAVLEYTQSDLVYATLILTQVFQELKGECLLEFRGLFEALVVRASVLMQELYPASVLDAEVAVADNKTEPMRVLVYSKGDYADDEGNVPIEEDLYAANRDFYAFCTFYLGELLRRFFYYDIFARKQSLIDRLGRGVLPMLPAMAHNVRAWVYRIVNSLAEQAFQDMYFQDTCPDAYRYVGDDRWFRYRWPIKTCSRTGCLAMLRPHLYNRYFSEEKANRRLVLVPSSYVSRRFVLRAISAHIHDKSGAGADIRWLQTVVVESEELFRASHALQDEACPLIVQVLSSFWTYNQATVYRTDNIYETIALWFYITRERYNSRLHTHDVRVFVEDALGELARPRRGRATRRVMRVAPALTREGTRCLPSAISTAPAATRKQQQQVAADYGWCCGCCATKEEAAPARQGARSGQD